MSEMFAIAAGGDAWSETGLATAVASESALLVPVVVDDASAISLWTSSDEVFHFEYAAIPMPPMSKVTRNPVRSGLKLFFAAYRDVPEWRLALA
jgi:hypothetical protein